jgi:hypothetical protein
MAVEAYQEEAVRMLGQGLFGGGVASKGRSILVQQIYS